MSHTPGPWRYMSICDENGEDDGGVLIGEHIVVADYLHLNNLANARLIAAAPELCEALEAAYMVLTSQKTRLEEHVDAVTLARAALAKARGEEGEENA